MTGRFQSDPIERRFSQYRQMSGGRFLVRLREVMHSERILACRSLIKEDINFWNENIKPDSNSNVYDEILECLCPINDEILECTLDNDSEEVAVTIAGYIAKKLAK